MSDYDLSNLRVLLVEKHMHMRRIIRDILQELGIRDVRDTADIKSAFAIFCEDPPDLVITDWAPGLDGIRLVRRIRRDLDSPDPYASIIVVTAHTEMKRVLTARDAGMTEFLAKPLSAKLLYYRIRSIVERQRLFVRANDFFGPDRRRRRVAFKGSDRRAHRNVSGVERRKQQIPFTGQERRQGFPGYVPQDHRGDGRSGVH